MASHGKEGSQNVQNIPGCATADQASWCHDAVVESATKREEYPPNGEENYSMVCPSTGEPPRNIRPFGDGEEEDEAGINNSIESMSLRPADKEATIQSSKKSRVRNQYGYLESKAQIKHNKSLSQKKSADAELLHHLKYEGIQLKCKRIIAGALQIAMVEFVIVCLDYITILFKKSNKGICLRTTELTKWTYGCLFGTAVSFLKTTSAAYQQLKSQMKWGWKNDGITNPEKQDIIFIFELCHDSEAYAIFKVIIAEIGVRNKIPGFCAEITSEEVSNMLWGIESNSAESNYRKEGKTKRSSKSKRKLRKAAEIQDLCDDEESNLPSTYLVVYPPRPAKYGISISKDDLKCLDEGEYINDTIIEFYLKYLVLEKLKESDAERIHVFSCFFYTCLTGGINAQELSNLEIQQQRHEQVKTWTQHVDLFEKDFIFVPINEAEHWFLAVICFPGLSGPVYEIRSCIQEAGTYSFDPEIILKQPCILLMDSLAGHCSSDPMQILREYLEVEWEVKRGTKRSFSRDDMKGSRVQVPQQKNFSDCGIFMLQFAESFLENPPKSFEIPMNLTNWFPYSRVEKKREEIRNILLRLPKP